jgi:SAM-dependent methyltransferase
MKGLPGFYNNIESTTGPAPSFRMRKTLDLANKFAVESILDVGCGDGQFTKMVGAACACKNVVGIDISKKLVAGANSLVAAVQASCETILPFKNEIFDSVLCSELIEHLIDPDFLLDEVSRVLKPRGMLFLTTPNLASWINRISLMLGYQPHFTEVSLHHNVGKLYGGVAGATCEGAIAGHVRLFVPRSLEAILKIHGFEILARGGAGLGYGAKSILPFPISAIDGLLSSRVGTSVFLVYAGRKKS